MGRACEIYFLRTSKKEKKVNFLENIAIDILQGVTDTPGDERALPEEGELGKNWVENWVENWGEVVL